MFAWKKWYRLVTPTVFVCLLVLAGCSEKKPEPTKVEGNPKPADPKATDPKEKKSGPLTADDLRAAAKAAGGDLDKPTPKADDTEELLKATPVAVLKEEDFAAEMSKNPQYLEKYDGKIIDIVGKIKNYDFSGSAGESLPEFMLDSFRYKYICQDQNALARVAPGQSVTLRARCSALVGFAKCVIVKVEGDPPEEISADKLAGAYAADTKGTEKKYKGKYVVLKGKARIIKEKPFIQVALTSPGVVPEIVCNIRAEPSAIATKQGWLKEGAEVQILCKSILGDPSFVDGVIRGPLKK